MNVEAVKQRFLTALMGKGSKVFLESYKPVPVLAEITLAELQQEFPDATADTWHQHPKGRGWVENTATVYEQVFVGPGVVVSGHVQIHYGSSAWGRARIGGHAILMGHCKIYGNARVDGNARLAGTCVFGSAHVCGNAQLGLCTVNGNALIEGDARLDDCQVGSSAVVRGHAHLKVCVAWDAAVVDDGTWERRRLGGV